MLEDFIREDVPSGLYLGAHLSYAYARIGDKNRVNFDEYISIEHVNFNFIAGCQLYLLENFIADFALGLGWKNNTWRERESGGNIDLIDTREFGNYYNSSINIFGNFSVGYAF